MAKPSSAALSSHAVQDYVARKDPEWQEKMVLQYASLIKYIAARLAMRLPPHIQQEDLISSGIIGLMDAIQKFDPSKNISFKTYAEFRIKGAMLDELAAWIGCPGRCGKKAKSWKGPTRSWRKTWAGLRRPRRWLKPWTWKWGNSTSSWTKPGGSPW